MKKPEDSNIVNSDKSLLLLAKSIILNKPINTLDFGRWNNIKSGSFVTAYRKPNDISSENVWCCMSNGEYSAINLVPQNVEESAKICATRDSRRTNQQPKMFAVDILSPKSRWRKVTVAQLDRNKNLTISVELLDGSSAIYLPSVWNERPEWTATVLIENLTRKAGASNVKDIYEIDTYEITETGSHNYGYFNQSGGNFSDVTESSTNTESQQTIMKILEKIWGFYQNNAQGSPTGLSFGQTSSSRGTGSTGPLAYLIKNRKITYHNQGALVRTLSDLTAYFKVAKILGLKPLKLAKRRVTREIERLRSQIKEPAEIAGWIELLLTFDLNGYLAEICENSLKLLKLQEKTPGIFGTSDLEFANPQALLALLSVVESIDCQTDKLISDNVRSLTESFLNHYQSHTPSGEISSEPSVKISSFGANWLIQALMKTYQLFKTESAKNYVESKLVPILKEAFEAKRSITEEATAVHALLVAQKYIDTISQEQLVALIDRWQTLQDKWHIGGFRYYENEAWYRTDVTSHVTEVLLLILNLLG